MTIVRRLVVDVLKPHEPPLVEFATQVADLDSVAGATVSLIELDKAVQNVKLTVEGEALDVAAVTTTVEELGGSIHSTDQVACGEYIVEDRRTPQD